MLWEQCNILIEKDYMLWEQNSMCGNKISFLWEQNIFLVGTKYLPCGNKIISCGNKILYLGDKIFKNYHMVLIKVITKLPNSEQSYKGKVKTHNYINRQNQSTTGKL